MAVSNTPQYTPSPPQVAPQTEDGRNLAVWVQQQLEQIAQQLNKPSRLHVEAISRPPTTPRTGDIAFADGTNWNPINLPEGTKQGLVTYYNGTWVQADIGSAMTITDLGLITLSGGVSGRPFINLLNVFNDANGCFIAGNKARGVPGAPANTNTQDVGLDFRGAGFIGGNFIQHSAMQFYQAGPAVGSFIPGAVNIYTSGASAFDHTFTFGSQGDLTIPEFLFAQFAAFKGASGTGFRVFTANTGMTTDHWYVFNGTGTITVTMGTFAPGSWVFMKTVANQAVVASAAVVSPLAGGGLGTAILPATAGKWALLVTDGTGNWFIMAAN